MAGRAWPWLATNFSSRSNQTSNGNGRGSRLFAEPHHDARAVRKEVGNIPLAGFFAAGELGPVGGQNFIHGFTASVALFGP